MKNFKKSFYKLIWKKHIECLFRIGIIGGMVSRSSLVVEHSLGKGEVEGPIPSYGTICLQSMVQTSLWGRVTKMNYLNSRYTTLASLLFACNMQCKLCRY